MHCADVLIRNASATELARALWGGRLRYLCLQRARACGI